LPGGIPNICKHVLVSSDFRNRVFGDNNWLIDSFIPGCGWQTDDGWARLVYSLLVASSMKINQPLLWISLQSPDGVMACPFSWVVVINRRKERYKKLYWNQSYMYNHTTITYVMREASREQARESTSFHRSRLPVLDYITRQSLVFYLNRYLANIKPASVGEKLYGYCMC
jgi:hypothetical protein